MMTKNELPSVFWRDFFPILCLGIRAMGYLPIVEPAPWKAAPDLRNYWPRGCYKHRVNMGRRRASPEAMGRWSS